MSFVLRLFPTLPLSASLTVVFVISYRQNSLLLSKQEMKCDKGGDLCQLQISLIALGFIARDGSRISQRRCANAKGGRGAKPIIRPNFSKNCIKIKIIDRKGDASKILLSTTAL